MAVKLLVHPAFYGRVRHYRDRIAIRDGRPQVAILFTKAVEGLVERLVQHPQRGHSARFESPDLADILRISLPGFSVFALFYRWDGKTLTVITLEHCAQDLPARLAAVISAS